MPTGVIIRGFEGVHANLDKQIKAMKVAAVRGMIKAAVAVKESTEKELPTTPRRTGNLRSSFYIVSVLGTEAGKGANFVGEDAGRMMAQHQSVTARALAEVIAATSLTVKLGYSANYAIWVHEMSERTQWHRDGSGPKWFERALKRKKPYILKIIGEEVKLTLIKGFPKTRTNPKGKIIMTDI